MKKQQTKHSRNHIMKTLAFLLLLLLLVTATATSAKLPTKTPQSVCRTSYYPILCNQLLSTYHPKTVKQMFDVAFTDIIAQLKNAHSQNLALSKQLGPNTPGGKNAAECAKSYADAASMVEQDIAASLKKGDVGTATFQVSGLSGTLSTCYDINDVDGKFGGKMQFPGSDTYQTMKQLSTNFMTVLCAANPGHCPGV